MSRVYAAGLAHDAAAFANAKQSVVDFPPELFAR